MKYLFCLFILMAGCMTADAQTVKTLADSGDTVVNTAAVYLPYTVNPNATHLAFQVRNTKISGTVAGTTILQESLDGTNFKTVIDSDTLTNTDVTTNSFIWKVSKPFSKYYRITSTGSGTMSMRTYGYVFEWRL